MNRPHQDSPFISVVLPIRNEEHYIRQVLEAILDQDYPDDRYEILIADGMSDDQTRAQIDQCLAERSSHPKVVLIDNPQRIVPTGLNLALAIAKGDVIVRIDGHAIMASNYLQATLAAMKRTGADNVGGPIRCIGRDWLSSAIALATSKPYGVGNSAFRTSTRAQYVDTVPFGAWRRELFERVGTFNEHFVRHQDYEFNHRTRSAGGKIYLDPEIQSQYFVRANLTKLARQYVQYGVWKAKMLKIFPGSLKWRHTVPPLFVLGLLVLLVASIFLEPARLLLAALTLVYTGFLLLATVLSCWQGSWRFAPVLPLIFATLHLSWGAGFWWGLPKALPHGLRKAPEPLGPPQAIPLSGYRVYD